MSTTTTPDPTATPTLKLYNVRIEFNLLCLATDEEDAAYRAAAEYASEELDMNKTIACVEWVVEITDPATIPPAWVDANLHGTPDGDYVTPAEFLGGVSS